MKHNKIKIAAVILTSMALVGCGIDFGKGKKVEKSSSNAQVQNIENTQPKMSVNKSLSHSSVPQKSGVQTPVNVLKKKSSTPVTVVESQQGKITAIYSQGNVSSKAPVVMSSPLAKVSSKDKLNVGAISATPNITSNATTNSAQGVSESGGATSQHSALPDSTQMMMEFENSPLSDSFQMGTISLSIPEFYVSQDNYIVLIGNDNQRFYYSVPSIVSLVGGRSLKEGDNTVYIYDNANKIILNTHTHTATFYASGKVTTLTLNDSNSVTYNGTLYVTSDFFAPFFNVSESLTSLSSTFDANFQGLKVQSAIYKSQLNAYKESQTSNQQYLDYSAKPSLIGLGRVQLYYTAMSQNKGSLNYNYYAPLLYGTFISSGTTGTNPFFQTAYLQYNLANNYIFAGGKNIYTSQYTYSPITGNFNGVYYGQQNVATTGYGTIDLTGIATSGNRVELYRSGTLIAFQYAQNNQYAFNNVVLVSPNDMFTIRIYNADGTYSEKQASAYSGIGFLNEGQSAVTGSIGNTNTVSTTGSNITPAHSVEVSYGLTSDLTTAISQSQGPLNTGVSEALYYKSDLIIPNYVIGQFSQFNNNLSRESLNQYFDLGNTWQVNYGYLYSNVIATNSLSTTLYHQIGGINLNLNTTVNYLNGKSYSETFSEGNSFANLYNTITLGATQQYNSTGTTQIGDNFSVPVFQNLNVLAGGTYYTNPSAKAGNVQLLYSTQDWSCSVQYSIDNQNNRVTTANFSMPIGLGLFDSISSTATSNGSDSLSIGKSIILAHPFEDTDNASPNLSYLYGKVYDADGTPYKGGTISVSGQTESIGPDGEYMIPDVTPNQRLTVDLSQASSNSNYGAQEQTMYIELQPAQGSQLNIPLYQVRNLFGSVIAPNSLLENIKIELLQNGKVIKSVGVDMTGAYEIPNITGQNYTLKVVILKNSSNYTISNNNIPVNFNSNSGWVVVQEPITIAKGELS